MNLEFANIGEMVQTQGRRYPDRIAIRFYERDITYRELDEQSNRVASGLLRLGVRKGDRVCMLMDNSPEFYYTYFGINKIGAIAGPVNCWWQIAEIRYLLKDSGAVVLFCDDSSVRGTQLRDQERRLYDEGAREIHLRIACPPLMFPCKFNFSTRSTNELAARRAIRSLEGRDIEDVSEYIDESSAKHKKMVDWICKETGATTLRYQKLDDMISAIGVPRDKLCLYCWTGKSCSKGDTCKRRASKTTQKNTAACLA